MPTPATSRPHCRSPLGGVKPAEKRKVAVENDGVDEIAADDVVEAERNGEGDQQDDDGD